MKIKYFIYLSSMKVVSLIAKTQNRLYMRIILSFRRKIKWRLIYLHQYRMSVTINWGTAVFQVLSFLPPPLPCDSHQYNSYKFIQTIHSLTMTSTFSGNLTSCKYKTQILKKVYTCIYAKSDASHEIHLKFPSEL